VSQDAGGAALKDLSDSIDSLKETIRDATAVGVAKNTLDNVVELATLRTHSLLEAFLQELFYLCLLDDPSVPSKGSLIPVSNRDEADLLLLSSGSKTEKYLSWLPLGDLVQRAELYLAPGHPFERLKYRDVEKRSVKELLIVRNSVAHPSDYAHQQFLDLAMQRKYPATRAADFLLSTRGGATEVMLLMTRAVIIARGLLATTDLAADAILEQESHFQASQKSPAGDYECVRCKSVTNLPIAGSIGPCPACETLTPCPHCGRTPSASSTWRRILA
jgi:hypothetical protein